VISSLQGRLGTESVRSKHELWDPSKKIHGAETPENPIAKDRIQVTNVLFPEQRPGNDVFSILNIELENVNTGRCRGFEG
jgi:hypothetical protein